MESYPLETEDDQPTQISTDEFEVLEADIDAEQAGLFETVGNYEVPVEYEPAKHSEEEE